MKKQATKSKSGFTIIEVVLVLAIAGLIFLMVFVALPAMQRSQRDTQRRNDYAALTSSVVNYMSNHNGQLPTSAQNCDGSLKLNDATPSSSSTGCNKAGADPNGNAYTIKVVDCNGSTACGVTTPTATKDDSTVYVIDKASCENGIPKAATGNRKFVVYGGLESGTFCNSNE